MSQTQKISQKWELQALFCFHCFQSSFNLLSLSLAASDSVHELAFLQCLSGHSRPSHPISAVLYTPDNSSYSSVLESYIRNLRFNTPATPKPHLIITTTHESHKQAAVICSKKHGLEIKIRSGGHDYEGMSYVSDAPFVILDMFNLSIHQRGFRR